MDVIYIEGPLDFVSNSLVLPPPRRRLASAIPSKEMTMIGSNVSIFMAKDGDLDLDVDASNVLSQKSQGF